MPIYVTFKFQTHFITAQFYVPLYVPFYILNYNYAVPPAIFSKFYDFLASSEQLDSWMEKVKF